MELWIHTYEVPEEFKLVFSTPPNFVFGGIVLVDLDKPMEVRLVFDVQQSVCILLNSEQYVA